MFESLKTRERFFGNGLNLVSLQDSERQRPPNPETSLNVNEFTNKT